jgi:hypothetical protein
MAACKNENCFAGFVRRFRPKTENEPASFYDETCQDCKGDGMKKEDSSETNLAEVSRDACS